MSLNCVNRFFLSWRGVSRNCIRDACREDGTEAALVVFGAERNGSRKGGNQIESDQMSLASGRSQKRLLRIVSRCAAKASDTPAEVLFTACRNRGNRNPGAVLHHRK